MTMAKARSCAAFALLTGPDLPIAVTLDPHANVTAAMCDLAQILVSFTTYPHVDIRATGRRVAELLHRAVVGDIRPADACARNARCWKRPTAGAPTLAR